MALIERNAKSARTTAHKAWIARFCVLPSAALILSMTTPSLAQVCANPGLMTFEVSSKIVRSRTGFTQGLEFRDGVLYESTGHIGGTTQLNTIALDGKVTNLADQGRRVFGEGLTIFNDEIVQLTWQEHQVFVYDLAGKMKRQMRNPRDGWGLSHDGTNLLFTDGGPSLYYADPKTFKIGKSVTIRIGKEQIAGVNELERVDDKLYGNVFTTRSIVRFDPGTGCIDAVADLSLLWDVMTPDERASANSAENVLNGIAYDAKTGLFYLTGKRWRAIFVGRFREPKP
ncbi:MAG: glutaminyl-peptide cyclotransferase [Rhizobiales bacterium]|nr:glutaminyl-peptide cyclotransferase [Hyphomicrobiales bacterium]